MRKGFTLIEMIIAVFLSMMVLIGIIAVSTSMIRQHFESMGKGELSGDTLISLDQMNKEIETADVLVAPNSGANWTNYVEGCANWSNLTGAPLNPAPPVSVPSFYYCVAPGTDPQQPNGKTLWRYVCNGCPPSTPSPCGSAPSGNCTNSGAVVYNSFYVEPSLAPNFFEWTPEGLGMHYIVGNPSATPAHPVPITYQVDDVLTMQKSYGDTSD